MNKIKHFLRKGFAKLFWNNACERKIFFTNSFYAFLCASAIFIILGIVLKAFDLQLKLW